MLGTLYPLALDALGVGKISVGPPYFDAVFVPLMAPVVLLMGVAPLARWKAAPVADIAARLKWPALGSAAGALLLPWVAGKFTWGIALGLFLAAWTFATTAVLLLQRSRGGASQLMRASRSFWAMVIAHVGVGVFIVGVTMVKGYEAERDVKMSVGDWVDVGGWRFTFKGVDETQGPNYVAARGSVEVRRTDGGGSAFTMHPEKRLYKVQQMPMTEAAIANGILRDLYVSLGEMIDERTWTLRVYHKPFVNWIWGGAFLMAFGGLLAVADRRYRVAVAKPAAEPAGEPVGAVT
jgi:cytochrome c-type biogenesis protein CcmF